MLLFLYGWICWERVRKIVTTTDITKDDTMPERFGEPERCDLCGLFGCVHILEQWQHKQTILPPAIAVGENIGEIASFPISKTEFNMNEEINLASTIPMGKPEQAERVLIPPFPRPPLIQVPSVSLDSNLSTDDWVCCSICKAQVCVKYLDGHLKVHTSNYKGVDSSRRMGSGTVYTPPKPASSTAITVINKTVDEQRFAPKLHPKERYRFRQISQACAASSVTQDGRYSDFTCILWLSEKPTVQYTSYSGGHQSTISKDKERFAIHIVYDSFEEYFTLNTKFLKRSSYSSWDNEETVPDRICDQKDLADEIKKSLLFFCISPKAAYKQFRKLFKQELVIDYSENKKACIVQTKNCFELAEKLKTTESYQGHGYEMWGGYGE